MFGCYEAGSLSMLSLVPDTMTMACVDKIVTLDGMHILPVPLQDIG